MGVTEWGIGIFTNKINGNKMAYFPTRLYTSSNISGLSAHLTPLITNGRLLLTGSGPQNHDPVDCKTWIR